MNEVLMRQINLVADKVRSQGKGMTRTQRRKEICQWTYQTRAVDPEFSYWGVLNSGKAGETLSMAPIKKQEPLYSLLCTTGCSLSVICDFQEATTKIEVVSISEILKVELTIVIPY